MATPILLLFQSLNPRALSSPSCFPCWSTHTPSPTFHSTRVLFPPFPTPFFSFPTIHLFPSTFTLSLQTPAFSSVSGTILLALPLQKSLQFLVHHDSSPPTLRSCMSSSTSDEKKKKKKNKRVHFTEDVVVSSRTRIEEQKVEVRRSYRESKSETKVRRSFSYGGIEENREMLANRVALYNGILRDRMAQRLAYFY